ncbi:MAG: signal peptide peptidase SppA [Chloroflexi bacterium]|nr:signal peptide peptidase SppA [Chloroflexota bacterium]
MTLFDLPRNAIVAGRNLLRSLRRKGLDYVVLPIRGPYPERTLRRDPLPFPFNRLPFVSHTVSLEDMRAAAEVLGNDRRVQGVVLRFDTPQAGSSALYSLRRILLDLRAQGKRLIAWLPSADTWDYYLASACDEIIIPPSARLSALGLRAEPLFLKDTLALVGVEADLESIAEYKVTPDTFRRSTMSEPHREMLDGVLDSLFDEIVAAIAEGRGLAPARVRELIDAMPLTPAEALEAGLIDAILYQDELATRLSSAPLLTWDDALRRLRTPVKWTTRQRIGVVSLEGLIVPGRSRRVPWPVPLPLPFGEAQAGAETIMQALRQAEADEHIAAVILHVETPGGSELASDLICREVRRLRERKPVVALMGGQATSGGYYVSALANRIVARPTTLTGSIGIWGGKFVLAGLHEKLGVRRKAVQRGAMAGLYSEMAPFSEEERARVRRDLGAGYARFKARVAEGRGMTEEKVEEIARGRVWTGVQAREIGLVDELGDFETALAAAKELAGLKPEREYTVVQVRSPRHELLPQPFPTALRPFGYAQDRQAQGTAETTWATLLDALQELARERMWALAPWAVRVRG